MKNDTANVRRAPINDMVINRAGKVLIRHENGEERWAYPIDARELMSVDGKWSFASKTKPPVKAKAVELEVPKAAATVEEKAVEQPQPLNRPPKAESRSGSIRSVTK